MAKTQSALTALLLASSLSAQTTYLSEDFSVFPPAGWTQVDYAPPSSTGWEYDAVGQRLFHDNTQAHSNHSIITPAVDLSNATMAYLHFDAEVQYAYADLGYGTIEASADGGQSWSILWRDQSRADEPYAVNVNLSSWLGASHVQFAIHYEGTFDHEWWVDNFVVDDQPVRNFQHSTGWLGASFSSYFLANGCSKNGNVALAFSLTGSGPTVTQFGLVDMSAPIFALSTAVADNQCLATLRFTMPPHASGVTMYTQCVDLRTNTLSDLLVVVVP